MVLGVKTKDEIADKIIGVNKEVLRQLKTEVSLEDFLKEKVKAIPSFMKAYDLETKIVEYRDDRVVIFIEVLNKYWERIYYSEISQCVYIRHAKSTDPLTIPDTLRLIAEKSYPQIYLQIEGGYLGKNTNSKKEEEIYNYSVYCVNRGVKPSEQAFSYLIICSDDRVGIFRGGEIFDNQLDLTNYDLDDIESYKMKEVMSFSFPIIRKRGLQNASVIKISRIYPFNKYNSINSFSIFKDDINNIKKVIAINIEDSGFVKQEFKITIKGNRACFEEIFSEFNPYITL